MRDDDLQLSLVWQAKNGNAQALNALLDANKGKIYAAAYALLKNREDAEDAMQQALIAVWQNIGKLAAPEAFETWLYRVTYTRSLNILKSRKNNEMVIENDIGDMPQAALLESELMLPHEYAERNDLRERLFLIIDSLSPVQRETVVLYYFHDKSVGEISEIMDCSAGTVKSRLYLARNTIRTEIEEQERKSGQKFFGFAVGAVPFGRFVAENTAKTMLSPQAGARILFAARQAAFAGGSVAAGAAAGAAATKAGLSAGAKAAIIIGAAATAIGITIGTVAVVNSTDKPEDSIYYVRAFEGDKKPSYAPDLPVGTTAAASTAPTEPTTQAASADFSEAYRAYLDTLSINTDLINEYDWQLKTDANTADEVSRPIVFADIMGDETPEMIVVSCLPDDEYRSFGYLRIYSYQNGKAENVYTQTADDELPFLDFTQSKGLGSPKICNYALFQVEGEKTLYFYAYGGLGTYTPFSQIRSFKDSGSGVTLQKNVFLCDDFTPQDAHSVYKIDGMDTGREECSQKIQEFTGRQTNLLMCNYVKAENDPTAQSLISGRENLAMTLSEARDYLLNQSGEKTKSEDFSVISGFFQGGVKQGPQNYFSAKENGEFYNVYVNDVARDGNYEYSALHGKIVDLKEKSQFVYTFRLDDRALENSPGTKGAESILKTEKTVTYIDNPLDVSGELTLYRKGIRPSQLPKAVKDKYQWDTKDYSDSPLNHSVIYYKDEKIEIYMFGRENNQYGYWK